MSAYNYLSRGLLLAAASLTSAVCVFVRNLIIARLISLEDYGIATTFALTMTLIEMGGNLAISSLIVQARSGDTPSLVATGHAFQLVRGVVSTLLLYAIARPVANLFDVPQATWAFRTIALVPLIRSFSHLDVAVQQRDMRFGGSAWMEVVPQLLIMVAAAPIALWLNDYRVMVVLILMQVAAGVMVSHLVAEQPYRFAWDRKQVRRMIEFGRPLMLNGVLMFAIFQGDKALVGASNGMEDLAWYGAAFGLALMPSLLFVKVLSPFMMPLLARKQDDRAEFERRTILTIQLCTIAGAFVALVFVLAGPALLVAAFGSKYSAGSAVIGWFGIMQGARIIKAGAAIVAVAQAETSAPLLANIVRCIGLAGAMVAVALHQGVAAVAVWGMVGESLAALAAILLLRWRLSLRIGDIFACVGASAIVFAAAQWTALQWFQGKSLVIEIGAGLVMSTLLSGFLVAAFPLTLDVVRRIAAETRSGRESYLKSAQPPAASSVM